MSLASPIFKFIHTQVMKLTLFGIGASLLVGGTSITSAQVIGKAAQISYIANSTSTRITIGALAGSGQQDVTVIRFRDLHQGDRHVDGAADTLFSDIVNPTAQPAMLIDLSMKLIAPSDDRGWGNSGWAAISVVDASTGAILEKVGSIAAKLDGRNKDTALTKRFRVDLSKYNFPIVLMVRSEAISFNPVLSFVDYKPIDTDLK